MSRSLVLRERRSGARGRRLPLVRASLLIALGIITTACGGGGYSTPSGGQAQSLTGVSVTAQSAPSIPVGGDLKLIANGTFGDPLGANPSYKDVTGTATWTSSDDAVATVAIGRVRGAGIGSVTITAKLGGHSAVMTVVVGLTPNIAVTPDGIGTFSLSHPQRQFFANATYSDSTVLDLTNYVTWTASPTAVIRFDHPYGLEPGLATFTSTGTATITATLRAGEEGNSTVTVDP